MQALPEREEIVLHGHRVCFRRAGDGPVILLVHGITGSSRHWERVFPILAERHTVIAPDLLGHGESAKPRGDYSLGAFASGIRDLLLALDCGPATIVGHSLGGGIAMQFAYQFPEGCERLVLVASGGLGGEVHLLLRAATLPGSELVLPLLTHDRLRGLASGAARGLRVVGLTAGVMTYEVMCHEFDATEKERRCAEMSRAVVEAFLDARHRVVDLDAGGDAVDLQVLDQNGKLVTVTMGSYGIGPSRAVAAIAENTLDEIGLCWPREVAPYDVHVIALPGLEEQAAEPQLRPELADQLALGPAQARVLVADHQDAVRPPAAALRRLPGRPRSLVATQPRAAFRRHG
jgi:pimeloyl-ACP methyl ester carboxylesterase